MVKKCALIFIMCIASQSNVMAQSIRIVDFDSLNIDGRKKDYMELMLLN